MKRVVTLCLVLVGCRLGDRPLPFGSDGGGADDMASAQVSDMASPPDLSGQIYLADLAMPIVRDMAMPIVHDFAGVVLDMVALTPCQMTQVATAAGNGIAGFADGSGGASGAAKFNGPQGLAVDGSGNVLVADCNNNRLRMIAMDGTTSTVAGNGTAAVVNGTLGPTGTTELNCPTGVAVDGSGNIYINDAYTDVRKISGGSISTINTTFSTWGVAVSSTGTVYVASSENNQIASISTTGTASIISGNGTQGFLDSDATHSEFNFPLGIAVDSGGSVYVADAGNNRLRVVAPGGATSTLAGNGNGGFSDGTGGPTGMTEFQALYAVAVDSAGNVYVADERNNRVRKVAPNGDTITIAGNETSGFKDGQGCTAEFNSPTGIAIAGNKLLYVSERDGNRVRKIQLP